MIGKGRVGRVELGLRKRAGRCRVLGLGMESKREGGGTWASCEDPLPDSSFFFYSFIILNFFLFPYFMCNLG
jgi:hypothetical protein